MPMSARPVDRIYSTENVDWTVTYLLERLAGYKFITLTAAPGKEEFYLKLGWLRQASAMIWPVSERQRELHALPTTRGA
jgi:hypothetical protein